MSEQDFHFSHWKDNPVCLAFFVSLEICELKDFHAGPSSTWEEGCDINVPLRDENSTVSDSQHRTNSVCLC